LHYSLHDGVSPTHILNQSITPAASVLNLLVAFDENFNFKQLLFFYHIRNIRRIRLYILLSVAKTIATYPISGILDQSNSILYNRVLQTRI